MKRFANRAQAGVALAEQLLPFAGPGTVILALPRGGVPLGYEIARRLNAPLDVVVVRKLGVPFQPELAMGAIGEDGARVLNEDVLRQAQVSAAELQAVEDREREELERRVSRIRRSHARVPLAGRTAILVDDGIATGATMRAACEVVRHEGAGRVVVGTPVAAAEAVETLKAVTDAIVCVQTPSGFGAVGACYDDFSEVSEATVIDLLHASAHPEVHRTGSGQRSAPGARERDVTIPAGEVMLPGIFAHPHDADGIVVFAHGSGSSRHSPRNQFVARLLARSGLSTLLLDLLTPEESRDRANVFDVALLADRLRAATHWLREQPGLNTSAIGFFGASTGAAAALWAATEPRADVAAVVSRGGRPDLAGPRLHAVRVPTLLIVGGEDRAVVALNQQAARQLVCAHEIAIVPGATHLFEEPGTLYQAAALARDWFLKYLPRSR